MGLSLLHATLRHCNPAALQKDSRFPGNRAAARNCGARGKPEDLQVIALDIDDDVGRTARGSILDVEISARIQRADEGTVLGRTGHNRDHSADRRIGRADQNIATGASGIWISDAPDDGACICRNRFSRARATIANVSEIGASNCNESPRLCMY